MARTMRGFTWRIHRAGNPQYVDEKRSGWAEKGTLPAEWQQVKQDPTVDHAEIYTSAQRRVRATKRKIVERHPQ